MKIVQCMSKTVNLITQVFSRGLVKDDLIGVASVELGSLQVKSQEVEAVLVGGGVTGNGEGERGKLSFALNLVAVPADTAPHSARHQTFPKPRSPPSSTCQLYSNILVLYIVK